MRLVGAIAIPALLLLPLPTGARTSPDRGAGMSTDGRLDDFSADEWVVDRTSAFPESPRDSRWGDGDEIRGLAVTWDAKNLYLGLDCTITAGSALLLIDAACGGPQSLEAFSPLERNLYFGGFSPNLLASAKRWETHPRMIAVDCSEGISIPDESDYGGFNLQGGTGGGALELAIPWALLGATRTAGADVAFPEPGHEIRILACITAGEGRGAGDACPDPSSPLPDDSTRASVLDNFVILTLDGDSDGLLDYGVSPREAARFAVAGASPRGGVPGPVIVLEKKLFAPDRGERARFRLDWPGGSGGPVEIAAVVYDAGGRRVRVLYSGVTEIPAGGAGEWLEWDGTGGGGERLGGGVYLVGVTVSQPGGPVIRSARAALSLVR